MIDHLRPTAPYAPSVLAPSEPGLALALAQRVLVKPLMANHHHGLWGYSGVTHGGLELTVQATGIGGPGTAAILGDLAELGARRVVRVARCAALAPGMASAAPVIVTGSIGGDAISARLGPAGPDPLLTQALAAAAAGDPVAAAGSDLASDLTDPARGREWTAAGAGVADLETAAALAYAHRRRIRLAAALVTAAPGPDDAVDEALLALGELCAGVLEGDAAGAQASAPGAVKLP